MRLGFAVGLSPRFRAAIVFDDDGEMLDQIQSCQFPIHGAQRMINSCNGSDSYVDDWLHELFTRWKTGDAQVSSKIREFPG